jgi:Flp pilus assembly protein TadG
MIEFALTLPVLLLLVFGITDLARAFYYSIEISGATRAGVREAIITEITDIGDAIRSEPNSAIANTTANWGDTGPGGANADCTSGAGSQHCGDPNGCPASVFTGTRIVCFAIQTCTLSNVDNGTCTSYGAWGTRPTVSASGIRGVRVIVVYKFTQITPVIGQLLPLTNGFLRLSQSSVGDELYF